MLLSFCEVFILIFDIWNFEMSIVSILFDVEVEEPQADEELLEIKPRVKKLANQFNFCERAALTYNNPRRVSILYQQ